MGYARPLDERFFPFYAREALGDFYPAIHHRKGGQPNLETLNFNDKKGNVIGSITFNPYDFGLIFRSCEYERKIKKNVDSLAHFNITAK